MRVQGQLPINPVGLAGVDTFVSFNASTSFATNTNWQTYGGETTMTYFTQMGVLTVQQFVSAAVGIAVRRGGAGLMLTHPGVGNFWVDIVPGAVYILLPLP